MIPCKLCNNKKISSIYSLDQVPIFQNKVFETHEEALGTKTGKVDLRFCGACGFIFNGEFNEKLMEYDNSYQNEQNHSYFFQKHLLQVKDLLIEKEYSDKKIIEIGCGKGSFLNLLKSSGFNKIIGFDPAYEGNDKNIIVDYFSSKYQIKGDLLILRHTLEHIENPFEFLKVLSKANGNQGQIYIEVPCFNWIKIKKAFWDIFFEHCNYFTISSLSSLFEKCESGSLFGGQYIYVLGDLKNISQGLNFKKSGDSNLLFEEKFLYFKKVIESFAGDKEKTAIWGAGAKGVTFLNVIDPKREYINYVIDINPRKQGKFIPRTGHQIISPSDSAIENLKNIIIMNENYKDEIISSINRKDINFLTLGQL